MSVHRVQHIKMQPIYAVFQSYGVWQFVCVCANPAAGLLSGHSGNGEVAGGPDGMSKRSQLILGRSIPCHLTQVAPNSSLAHCAADVVVVAGHPALKNIPPNNQQRLQEGSMEESP